jgi:predicted ATPase
MGENSSGKSSVLQSINLALSTFGKTDLITDRNDSFKIRNKGIGMTTLPGLNISDFRELYYAKISRSSKGGTTDGTKIGALISLTDNMGSIYKLQISSLFGGFNLKCLSTPSDLKSGSELHKHVPLFISGFVGLRSEEERSFPVAIEHKLSSGDASTVIRNLVYNLKHQKPENYRKLVARMQKDFGFFLDDVEFEPERDLYVKAHYSENCEQKKLSLGFNSSGSGYMQLLQILTPIYTFCPETSKVVLLDEPDAHLHPNLQTSLALALRSIQRELNIQIIISTHSTSIIRTASPNEVIPISSDNKINSPLVAQSDVEQIIINTLDSYELGKSVISGKLIFIEDQNIKILETFDRVLSTNCFVGANTVPFVLGRGKDDKIPFQIKVILLEYLKKDIEIYFVRDGDGLNGKWRSLLQEYAERYHVHLHQLELYEIENYILNEELIYRTLVNKYPGEEGIPDINTIRGKIIEFLKNTIALNKYNYDDNLEDSIYKTAMLLSMPEYRNPVNTKKEADSIRSAYEDFSENSAIKMVGMGKESLSEVLSWLNRDIKLNISRDDICAAIIAEDVPEEVKSLLQMLKSNAYPVNNTLSLPPIAEETNEDIPDEIKIAESDSDIDKIVQLSF